jgi:pSer/pThr/pTyr-binding forkhead associated (FHA) protein
MDVNLVLLGENGSQKTFSLPSNVTVIGRRRDCDLRIPLVHVSRRHCQISSNKDTLKVRDLGSRNGTYLNGKRIKEATIQPGDYLTIGPLTFLLQINGQPKEIKPPQQSTKKPPQQPAKKPPAEVATDEGSSFAMELDVQEEEPDSFLAELEDL